jgi:hypothetical protein
LGDEILRTIESSGIDPINDIHVRRTPPGYYFAILYRADSNAFAPHRCKSKLQRNPDLNHVTVAVKQAERQGANRSLFLSDR